MTRLLAIALILPLGACADYGLTRVDDAPVIADGVRQFLCAPFDNIDRGVPVDYRPFSDR